MSGKQEEYIVCHAGLYLMQSSPKKINLSIYKWQAVFFESELKARSYGSDMGLQTFTVVTTFDDDLRHATMLEF